MTAPDTRLLAQTAADYDRFLVPAVFRPVARLVADRSGIQASQKGLDVGCGPGVLARELAARAGAEQHIVGLDANPGMIEVARQNAPGIGWHLGDAAGMLFEDGAFDVVASQFALMLFENQKASLQEMWRVLGVGGTLIVAVFDGLSQNDGYGPIADICQRHAGSDVANALRCPFSLGDADQLLGLFDAAGIAPVALDAVSVSAHFPSALTLAQSDIKGWFPFAGLALSDETTSRVVGDLDAEFGGRKTSDGQIVFDVHAHIVAAQKT